MSSRLCNSRSLSTPYLVEQRLDFRLGQNRQSVDRALQIHQTTLGGFLMPGCRVAVAVEDDRFALVDDLGQQLLHRAVQGLGLAAGGLLELRWRTNRAIRR